MTKRRLFRPRPALFAVSALLLCLGAAAEGNAASGSAADRAWVLDTLKRYSPDGSYILESYRAKVPKGTDFMEYWDGEKDEERWESLNTIVHEIAHGYMGELADYNSIYYYISPSQSIMVKVGQVFRTKEMVPSIPEELRSFRFSYVDSDDEILGSQSQGAYGLLDEMAAYWVGCQAAADMAPLFLADPGKAPWIDFFNSVDASLYGIVEFRFFVLKYLGWARDREPAVYRDIIANKAFKRAFVALDLRSRDFVAAWFQRTPAILDKIRKAGLTVKEDGASVMIGSGGRLQGFGTFMDVYELLRREMAKPAYAPLLSALYDGKSPPAWPDSGVQPAARGNYDAREADEEGGASIGTSQVSGDAPAFASAAASTAVKAPTGRLLYSISGKDRKGEVKKPFCDIVRADVAVREDGAVFRLELASLPAALGFEAASLEEGTVEYEWAFDIDLEGEGSADYSVSLSSFKTGKGGPRQAPLLEGCSARAWKVEGDSATSIDAPVSAALDGSTIVLTLGASPAFPLASIGEGSFVTAKSFFDSGAESGSDSLEL